jgi:hypothetical protein
MADAAHEEHSGNRFAGLDPNVVSGASRISLRQSQARTLTNLLLRFFLEVTPGRAIYAAAVG